MGLRINTGVGALTALRNLRSNSTREIDNFQRLATGSRILRASDDPSGLVLLEVLRPQLIQISQAIENTQNARNLVDTADAALGQISDRLVELRSLFLAGRNTGVAGPEAQGALQDAIDQSLAAIDRIAATTRFADQPLLNGNLGFALTGVSAELDLVDVQGGAFQGGFPQQVTVDVVTAATRAQATGTIAAVQSGASVVNVTGPLGTEQLNFAAGATQSQVVDAINAVTGSTGVEATAGGEIRTVAFGSDASFTIQEVTGDFEGITPGTFTGTDVVAQVNGQAAVGRGNTIQANTTQLAAVIQVQAVTTGTFQFTIQGGGATFQIGPVAGGLNDITIGIGAVSTATLGQTSGQGTLASVQTGGLNSLQNRSADAFEILDAAMDEVSGLRSRLGSVAGRLFEANTESLNEAFQNLSASASELADANFAEEITQAVRNRLVRESGLLVLGQANLTAGQALRLLS